MKEIEGRHAFNISENFTHVTIHSVLAKCAICDCDTNNSCNEEHEQLFNLSKTLGLSSACDILDLCVNVVCFMLILYLWCYRRLKITKRTDLSHSYFEIKKCKKYWCHVFRNVLALVITFLWCLNTAEVIIRWIYSPETRLKYLVLLAPISSIFNTFSIGLYYDFCERLSAHHLYLLLPIFIWCLHILSVVGRLYEILCYYCVPVTAVAPSLYLIIGAFNLFILIIDLSTIFKWALRKKRKASADVTLHNCPKSGLKDRKKHEGVLGSKVGDGNRWVQNRRWRRYRGSSFSTDPSGRSEDDDDDAEGRDILGGEEHSGQRLRYNHDDEGILSRCTYWWYVRVLRKGWENPLEFSDLDKIPEEHSSRSQFEKFQDIYEDYEIDSRRPPRLWRVCFTAYWRPLAIAGVFKFLGDIVNVVGPLVISPIVDYVRKIQEGTWELQGQMSHEVYFVFWKEFWLNGWVLCFLALVASLMQSTLSQTSSHILTTEGIHIRTALQAKIYDKSLKISVEVEDEIMKSEREQSTETGKVINLSSDDAENVMSFFMHFHYLWAIPFKMSSLVALLWLQMGPSAVYATLAAVFSLAPIQFFLGKGIKAVNYRIQQSTDKRLGKTHESLLLIRTLKALALEEVFLERVNEAREEELHLLLRDGLLRALLTFLTQASGIMIILLTFGFYSMSEDNAPNEGAIFSSLALFSQLTVALFILPSIVQHTIKAIGSVHRLERFFNEPEVTSSKLTGDHPEKSSKITVEISADSKSPTPPAAESHAASPVLIPAAFVAEGATFAYGGHPQRVAIREVSFRLQKGKLTTILGEVGSGKTSFLLSLLSEITLISGRANWTSGKSVAYVSQRPWLLNCTLRENILMGKSFQSRKYRKIIDICSLQPDIDLLPEGDATEIGERGINLSGGQRQRVAIARALYSDLSVIIMDCPFSALDPTVAFEVFRKMLNLHRKKGLESTIIVATQHQVLCSFADDVIYLENKRIKCQGAPQEVAKNYPELWNKVTSPSSPDGAAVEPEKGEGLIRERMFLHRQLSKISRHSRKGSRVNYLTEDLKSLLEENRPRKELSLLMSSPLSVLLPADEVESVSGVSGESKRISRVPKASVFRTSSSSPSFGRSCSDYRRFRSASLERRLARSLPSRPISRGRSSSAKERRGNGSVSVKRQDSVLRNLFSSSSFRKRMSESKLAKNRWNSRLLSLLFRKGFQIPEEGEDVEVESTEEEDEAEASEDEYQSCDESSQVFEALIDEEERERGKISKWNYVAYLRACGWALGGLFLFFMIANQGTLVALDVWLGRWSEACIGSSCEENSSSSIPSEGDIDVYDASYGSPLMKFDDNFLLENIRGNETVGIAVSHYSSVNDYLVTFGSLSGFAIAFGFLAIYMNQIAAHRGRKILHERMLRSVLAAKVKFFDLTPVGRILNRFSKDVSHIDKEISWSVMQLIYFSLLCSSAILVNVIISPIFILVSIPICLIYYIVQHVFRCSSRELKRLESLSRSPVIGLITETADFPVVVRAYGLEGRFLSCYFRRLDSYLSTSVLFHAGNRWLGISLDYMGCLIVFLATLACLVGSTTALGSLLTPLTVGLAIKYTLAIPIYLNWLVRFLSSTEMCLNSVERVQQYTRLISEVDFAKDPKVTYCPDSRCRCKDTLVRDLTSAVTEDPETLNRNLVPKVDENHLSFENVYLFYDKESDPVISNVSFKIPFGQKVGICGRTGSGKSSLLMGILRMVEKQEGYILINGVDAQKIPLPALRKEISVVCQEAYAFNDTIRFNMDPKNRFKDEALWDVLDLVFLKEFVASLPQKLDSEIGQGKVTLSAGQTQLLILTRVLLEKKSLVLLDEFAASLDPKTERRVMAMLRQHLSGSTVLMATHSIPSLLSCERILSIDGGKLVEDGPPAELAERKGGVFFSLLQSTTNKRNQHLHLNPYELSRSLSKQR